MANLNQVVELDAVFNHRVLQGAAVYAGVGANLHVITYTHSAELFDLFPAFAIRRKAEAIGTNHHTSVQDAARTNNAVFTHGDARFEYRARAYARTLLHHAQGADAGAGVHLGTGIYHRTGVNAGQPHARLVAAPKLGQARKVQIGVVGHDQGQALWGQGLHGGRHNHAGCVRAAQLCLVARVAQKTDVLSLGGFQRCQTLDLQGRVARQGAAQRFNNKGQ